MSSCAPIEAKQLSPRSPPGTRDFQPANDTDITGRMPSEQPWQRQGLLKPAARPLQVLFPPTRDDSSRRSLMPPGMILEVWSWRVNMPCALRWH